MSSVFKPVSSQVNFPELEKHILAFWKERDVFRRTETEREGGLVFMLYEGPPTANGRPGIHHVLARVFKDIIPRYKTMKGFKCVRKGGWDTHGLPVELEVERELGLKSKREIEEYGIERFNKKCRESVFRYVKDWEAMTDRVAYWVDMEHPYITLANDYIESCWWIFRQLWDKGLVYQDMKGTPHCPRCVTSLSSHEVAQGYQENTPDPSVYVKFEFIGESPWVRSGKIYQTLTKHGLPIYFLAWTTTPWTLPGNTALAVAAQADYSLVELDGRNSKERVILASALVDKIVQEPHKVLETFTGNDLVGLTYEKLYDPIKYEVEIRQFRRRRTDAGGYVTSLESAKNFIPRVVDTESVSLEQGTGIVHMAPAFGDEDLNLGRYHELAFVQQVDLQGKITGTYPFAGKFVKDADADIMADLQSRGLLYRRETYYHTYPFCWRCDMPLLYYAKNSWYIRTTAFKDRLMSGNQEINWYPEHIKEGRFGEWLRNNVDWAISRERYWGTPLPIWICTLCNHQHCVGTVSELKQMALQEHKKLVDDLSLRSRQALDLHRPYVDEVFLSCPKCGGEMRRVPDVMDCWYDSGAMPFAQWHVTSTDGVRELESKSLLPADYICEAIDQTRGWFYSLHALSTLLAGKPCYRNVICLGLILDEQGRKMSKHLGNVVEPMNVFNSVGADPTRWYLYTATPPGESRRFSQALVQDVVRRFMLILWNVYSFFVTYANIDGFTPRPDASSGKASSPLDRWLLSELNALVAQVTDYLEHYNPTDAGRRIEDFVGVLSTWYVRRSRRRFWKSENDEDKLSAYATLYTALEALSRTLAPFTPFLAEELYQNLVRSWDTSAPESVHLARFPEADASLIDKSLMEATRLAMRIAGMGRAARAKAGIKVRQPLKEVLVKPRMWSERELLESMKDQVLEELNVKQMSFAEDDDEVVRLAQEKVGSAEGQAIVYNYSAALESGYIVAVDTTLTEELKDEGLARELVHRVQNMRKAAGFELTDRIVTYYQGTERLQRVMTRFADYIKQETLSEELRNAMPEEGAFVEKGKVEGMEVSLGVRRVG